MAIESLRKSSAQHRIEAQGYMLVCTDAQLRGVIEAETQRIKNHGPLSDVTRVARIMLEEAEAELGRRDRYGEAKLR